MACAIAFASPCAERLTKTTVEFLRPLLGYSLLAVLLIPHSPAPRLRYSKDSSERTVIGPSLPPWSRDGAAAFGVLSAALALRWAAVPDPKRPSRASGTRCAFRVPQTVPVTLKHHRGKVRCRWLAEVGHSAWAPLRKSQRSNAPLRVGINRPAPRLLGACAIEKRPELFVSTDAPPSGKFALSLRACWGGEVRPVWFDYSDGVVRWLSLIRCWRRCARSRAG